MAGVDIKMKILLLHFIGDLKLTGRLIGLKLLIDTKLMEFILETNNITLIFMIGIQF